MGTLLRWRGDGGCACWYLLRVGRAYEHGVEEAERGGDQDHTGDDGDAEGGEGRGRRERVAGAEAGVDEPGQACQPEGKKHQRILGEGGYDGKATTTPTAIGDGPEAGGKERAGEEVQRPEACERSEVERGDGAQHQRQSEGEQSRERTGPSGGVAIVC